MNNAVFISSSLEGRNDFIADALTQMIYSEMKLDFIRYHI